MKLTVNVKNEVEVKTLHVDAGVRYWEDSSVNGVEDEAGDLIPCREGDRWKPIIDLETGVILNWDKPVNARIHYKICDDGKYTLKDSADNVVTELDGYVPKIMCPTENGYGDYVIMNIDEKGTIEKFKADLKDFEDED